MIKQHATPLENVTKMSKEFGLAAATGVDLPSEAKGLVHTWTENAALRTYYYDQQCLGAYGGKDKNGKNVKPNHDRKARADDKAQCDRGLQPGDKILYPGNYADEYIGQGVLTTPLQMAVAYAALVNGGQVFSPKVAKAVVTPAGQLVKAIKPQVQRTLDVSQTNLTNIKNAMYDVVTTGTAKDTFADFPLDKVLGRRQDRNRAGRGPEDPPDRRHVGVRLVRRTARPGPAVRLDHHGPQGRLRRRRRRPGDPRAVGRPVRPRGQAQRPAQGSAYRAAALQPGRQHRHQGAADREGDAHRHAVRLRHADKRCRRYHRDDGADDDDHLLAVHDGSGCEGAGSAATDADQRPDGETGRVRCQRPSAADDARRSLTPDALQDKDL